jgi:hypothetical protein
VGHPRLAIKQGRKSAINRAAASSLAGHWKNNVEITRFHLTSVGALLRRGDFPHGVINERYRDASTVTQRIIVIPLVTPS